MSNVTDEDIRRYCDTTDDEASETICLIALGHQGAGVLSHMSQTMARALVELEIQALRGAQCDRIFQGALRCTMRMGHEGGHEAVDPAGVTWGWL